MQSALPFPSTAAGGLLRPGAPNLSDLSTQKAPIAARPALPQQHLIETADGTWLQQQASTGAATIAQTAAAAVRSRPSSAQAALRPQRPIRNVESIQWSPTRELLSEPQKSLHEVARSRAQLVSGQQITSQVLLRSVLRTLGTTSRPPLEASRHAAAGLQAAAAVAAQHWRPQASQQRQQQQHIADHRQQQQVKQQQGSSSSGQLLQQQTEQCLQQQQQQQQQQQRGQDADPAVESQQCIDEQLGSPQSSQAVLLHRRTTITATAAAAAKTVAAAS